jgi:predicted amidohydrolase YtcJ
MIRTLLLAFMSVMASRAAPAACTPDLIIVNAKVHTVDAKSPRAEAIAICGEVISHVGTAADVRRLAAAGTRVIDAGGRLVVPGFNDAHVHFISGADEILGVDLRPARDERDFARRLGEYARRLPKGRWITGGYWDHEKAIFDADAAGFQPVVHAIGDRANAIVLDAFEKLVRERGPRDRRPRIEHAQVVRDADKKRFQALGVIASIQPSHCIDDMRWAEKRIGRERSAIAYDFKSFVEAGARIAFGTDWYVEPLNPMLGLYAAVTRQFPDGTPPGGWHPEERITMEEAVEFYTLGSAYAEFADGRKGSITAGKLADLAVLSRDLFTIPPREILDTRPVVTIVGGRVVYEGAAR